MTAVKFGQIWHNTTTGETRISNGNQWLTIADFKSAYPEFAYLTAAFETIANLKDSGGG